MILKKSFLIFILVLIVGAGNLNLAYCTTEQIDNDAGLVDYYQGNYDSAMTLFKNAISKNPNYAEAYFNLGRCYLKKNNLDFAIKNLEMAVKLNNNYKSAIALLKKTKKIRAKKLKNGAKSGSKFRVKISPELSYPWKDFTNAFYCYYDDKAKECKAEYTKMINEDPYNIRPYMEKGIIYYELKMYKEAISFFKKAYKLDSKNVHVLYDLGLAYEMNNNRDTAAWFYRHAIEINPTFYKASERLDSLQGNLTADYLSMAKRSYEQGNWKRSLEYLNKGLKFARVGSSKYRKMSKLKKIVTARVNELKSDKKNVKYTFLEEKYSYDDVYINGQIRYVNSKVIWNGVIEKIYERNGETILQLFYINDLSNYTGDEDILDKPDSNNSNNSIPSKKKYFQVHCGRILPPNGRLAEDSTVEVYGTLSGLEPMIDGYKYGISTDIPRIDSYKLYISCQTCSGTLVIDK